MQCMTCAKGGLILHRQDDVAMGWGEMCARSLKKPSAVSNEPFIHTGRDKPKATGKTGAPIDQGDL